jgi:hypothetical protein
MRLVKFGAINLTELDANDQFQSQARRSLSTLPNGAFDNDGDEYIAQPTRVQRRFTFAEQNGDIDAIQSEFDALTTEINKGRRILTAKLRDGTPRQTWAKVSRIRNNFEHGNMASQSFDVAFEIDYPYWIVSSDEPLRFDTGLFFDTGLSFDSGQYETLTINAAIENFTLVNDGGAEIRRGELILTVQTASSAAAIQISNAANGMSLTLTDSFVAGDVLQLDFLPLSVTKNGSNAYSILSIPADQYLWMFLELGDNDITITTTGLVGTIEMSWQWSRQYIA